jgi:hypothetical protein
VATNIETRRSALPQRHTVQRIQTYTRPTHSQLPRTAPSVPLVFFSFLRQRRTRWTIRSHECMYSHSIAAWAGSAESAAGRSRMAAASPHSPLARAPHARVGSHAAPARRAPRAAPPCCPLLGARGTAPPGARETLSAPAGAAGAAGAAPSAALAPPASLPAPGSSGGVRFFTADVNSATTWVRARIRAGARGAGGQGAAHGPSGTTISRACWTADILSFDGPAICYETIAMRLITIGSVTAPITSSSQGKGSGPGSAPCGTGSTPARPVNMDAACPVSTGEGTRRVRSVRGGGGVPGASPQASA